LLEGRTRQTYGSQLLRHVVLRAQLLDAHSRAGLGASHFGIPSLCVGGTTYAATAGMPFELWKEHDGWRSVAAAHGGRRAAPAAHVGQADGARHLLYARKRRSAGGTHGTGGRCVSPLARRELSPHCNRGPLCGAHAIRQRGAGGPAATGGPSPSASIFILSVLCLRRPPCQASCQAS
jgi:hypothetical protein